MTRKEVAQKHHELVLERDSHLIKESAKNSTIYNQQEFVVETFAIKPVDCVSALFAHNRDIPNCVTMLNFASFTNPGGGWLNGAWAQEESLCSESNLYEILTADVDFERWYKENRQLTKGGLYANRAIFTPGVKFERDNNVRFCNVLTCAAPNYNRATDSGIKHDTVVGVYRDRVKFIYDILQKENQTMLIGGLWGCGVFGFPRDLAINIWKEEAKVNTILAIPEGTKYKPKRSYE